MGFHEAHYRGNENIGFYGVVSDEYAIFARDFKWEEGFENPVETRIGQTDLLGIFAAGNSNGIVVPDLVERIEVERLEEEGVDFEIIGSKFTALGNLVLCNDNGCVISEHLEGERESISEHLGVPVETGKVAGLDIPGSCGVATNRGVLLHREASEEELERVEEVLEVEGDIGSVNFGTPYVHSGILANSEELLVGNRTTGPEVQRVQDALGFL